MTTQTETPQENTETKETPTIETKIEAPTNQIEVAARESGWVSKDEWVAKGKNPDEWRSAKEYQDRGELLEAIQGLKEDAKKTKAAFNALVEHHKKVREDAYTEAVERLKRQRQAALEADNTEAVYQISEELENIKSKTSPPPPEIQIDETDVKPSSTFSKWHKRNNWYHLDANQVEDETEKEASLYANVVGANYKQKNPKATEAEMLEEVAAKIAKKFPELFDNPEAKKTTPTVSSSSKSQQNTDEVFKLTADEERACAMFEKFGMSRKDYVAELKKLRGQ